ncbi:DUF192 domain-containing protein [bacterium]|nr:DUF192 domain-containing protein [bacterium]
MKLKFLTTSIDGINIVKIILLILPIVVIGGFITYFIDQSIPPTFSSDNKHLIINQAVIDVEVADEFQEQVQGLSDRPELGPNNGLLFIFKEKQKRQFWMKNMNFPIDIIWIAGDYVAGISKRLEPEGETPEKRYPSLYEVDKVLEVNGGFTDAFGIRAGDKVKFSIY